VEISLHVFDEAFVDLIIGGHAFGVVLLELTEQKHVFLAFEQTRNLT
jgi:hypothetical protein